MVLPIFIQAFSNEKLHMTGGLSLKARTMYLFLSPSPKGYGGNPAGACTVPVLSISTTTMSDIKYVVHVAFQTLFGLCPCYDAIAKSSSPFGLPNPTY